jgi:hypothetical protein
MSTLTLIALSLIGLVALGLLTIIYSGVVGGALLLADKLLGKETD